MKLNWKNTFILGLGFFAISLMWPIYNVYMPILYSKFVASKALIGVLMTLDNWLALTITPVVGILSDRTRTRFGRRIPYLLVGAPVAAIFMALIPLGWATSLALFVTFAVMMNVAMASFRSPVIALMPDVTPAPLRSKANGIINFMGGFGYIAATFGGAILYKIYPSYPFYGSALVMVAVTIAFLLWIREPAESTEKSERFTFGRITDRSAIMMLLAIFFWFVAYNSLETWLSTYVKEHLGYHEAETGFLLTVVGALFILFAIPAGFLAEGARRWKGLSRKWTIILGLGLLVATFFLMGQQADVSKALYLFAVAGIAWALVNINSYPMITQMAGPGQVGTYTGMYYLFQSLAMIAGPPIYGWIFDKTGYGYFFPLSAGIMGVALICMLFVTKGEASRKAAADTAA
ncbi:MAG: MFS transporter [Bacillota bacterium]